jgi:hypothetical protein
MENAQGFGESLTDSLASYDPDTSSWRTCQLSVFGGLSEFSETWPRAGLMRSGTVYQRVPLVPLTREIESGLWPTPVAQEGGVGKNPAARGRKLHIEVQKWPTPRREDYKGASSKGPCAIRRVATGEANLPEAVQMDTPGPLNPTWVEWLMGYPLGWTALEGWGTRSSRKLSNGLGKESLRPKRNGKTDRAAGEQI